MHALDLGKNAIGVSNFDARCVGSSELCNLDIVAVRLGTACGHGADNLIQFELCLAHDERVVFSAIEFKGGENEIVCEKD